VNYICHVLLKEKHILHTLHGYDITHWLSVAKLERWTCMLVLHVTGDRFNPSRSTVECDLGQIIQFTRSCLCLDVHGIVIQRK